MSNVDNVDMRTTIRMNEELARRAKQYAARHDRTFTEVIEEAVTQLLAKPTFTSPRKPIVLPTVGDPKHRITRAQYRKALAEADFEYDTKKLAGGTDEDAGR